MLITKLANLVFRALELIRYEITVFFNLALRWYLKWKLNYSVRSLIIILSGNLRAMPSEKTRVPGTAWAHATLDDEWLMREL